LLTRSRTRTPVRRAILATMAAVAGGVLAVLPMTPADATTVTYQDKFWSGFHTLSMRVLNDTDETITEWRIDFDLPPDTWPAYTDSGSFVLHMTFSDTGNHVTVTNPSVNPVPLRPRTGAIFIDIIMRGSGTPSNCLLDGTDPCVQLTP
jgi:hypothetical protein